MTTKKTKKKPIVKKQVGVALPKITYDILVCLANAGKRSLTKQVELAIEEQAEREGVKI